MSKIRVLNLRGTDVVNSGALPEMYSDRFVIPLKGHRQDSTGYHEFTEQVNIHLSWSELPWLMRLIWVAWWHHKKTMVSSLEWIEGEIGGKGVTKP